MKYVIVGFGCAGYHAARAIRGIDSTGEIHIFEAGMEPPANPMLTTYYTADKITWQAAHPFGTLKEIMDGLGLVSHHGTYVKRLDLSRRELILEHGGRFRFDKLLISTGARAFLPGLEGLPDERVYLMRTMQDARRLRERLSQKKVRRAVVVGASMVGIKVSELLWKQGVKVTMADAAAWLFPLAAYEPVAREIESRLAREGYHFKWNAGAEAIVPEGIAFTDGTVLPAEVICLCIGTRANVELAANTQLLDKEDAILVKRGIVVDEHQRTSCPDIYAAGDCCEGRNLQTGETSIIGLWANAGMQGETAGKNMAGDPSRYPGSIVHNITHFMGMDFIGLGDIRLPGKTMSYGSLPAGNYIQMVENAGRIQSINILGNHRISGPLKSLLCKQLSGECAVLPQSQREILLREGISPAFLDRIGGEQHGDC